MFVVSFKLGEKRIRILLDLHVGRDEQNGNKQLRIVSKVQNVKL